jgi:hypothetical protein
MRRRPDLVGRFLTVARIASHRLDRGDKSALHANRYTRGSGRPLYSEANDIDLGEISLNAGDAKSCRLSTNLLRLSCPLPIAHSPHKYTNTHDRAPSELAIGIHRLVC